MDKTSDAPLTAEKRKIQILAVDDDEQIRALLGNLLSEDGAEVDFAGDGVEVFKSLGQKKYDLLILDVNMPGMSGYNVAEKVTLNLQNRPKILIFTVRDIREDQLQFTRCRADAILQKGSSNDKILETIGGLLASRQKETAPPDYSWIRKEGSFFGKLRGDNAVSKEAEPPHPAIPRLELEEEIKRSFVKISELEYTIKNKNIRYEEFIAELLAEKQKTENTRLESARLETELAKVKKLLYAMGVISILALIKALF
jgi:DNA-binding response OmpR family regulator